MIFLPYDETEYLMRRGMNFDYQSVTPGAKPETMREFMKELADAFLVDSYKEERVRVNKMLNEVMVPCAKQICQKVLSEDWTSL